MRFFPGFLVLAFVLSAIAGCDADSPKRPDITSPAATFNRLIDERGPLTYLSRSYSAPGVVDRSSEVTGMVVMRHPADLRPIGGRYYDDGFGNLVSFGDFVAPALGGRSRYALTFRKDGGMQLALDFRDDAIVDAVFDLDRDGRLGALADPDTQWLLDCLSQELMGGANLAAAASTCLAKAGGGGGGGGLGPAAAHDVDRLAKPDCEKRGGLPGSVTQPGGGHQSTIVMMTDDGYKVRATNTENSDGSSDYEITMHDQEGRLVYHETGHKNADGEMESQMVRTFDRDPGRPDTVVIRTRDYEDGKLVEDFQFEFPDSRRFRWQGLRIEDEEDPGAPSPTRQPGPECEDCPVEDPRCREAPNDIVSLWDCQAQTDMSLLECLKRMQDVIYTATGGRCSTEVGADDRPNIKCSERRLQECLSAGRSIADCIRENPGYGGGDIAPGPEDDDFLRGRYGQVRGRVGMVIDTTPMGGVFIALCAEGLEQFCRGGGRF